MRLERMTRQRLRPGRHGLAGLMAVAAALGWSAPAVADAASDEFDKALSAASTELMLPPEERDFFEPRIILAPDGKLIRLDIADPALASLEAQWTAALRRHEPYPRSAGQPDSRSLAVRVIRQRLVPGSVTVAALDDSSAAELVAARALLRLALESLSRCTDSSAGAVSRPTTLRLDEVVARFDASGALVETGGIPSSAPFAPCLDALLRGVRLPRSASGLGFKLGFAVESGPARVALTLAEESARLPDVKRRLRDEEGALWICFEDELRRDPSLFGRMTTRLVIDGSGSVVSAQVIESTVANERVESCVLGDLRKLRFPAHPSDRPLSVVHPVIFRIESLRGGLRAEEDNGWLTGSSEHFVLYTEGGRAVAQRALEEAERAYQGLRLALAINLGTVVDDARPMTLFVISSSELYTQVALLTSGGEFRAGVGFGEDDVLVLRGVGQFEALRHEITHRLVSKVAPRLPAWLSEGLAQYYEWTEIDTGSITAGSTAQTRTAQRLRYRSRTPTPLTTLLASTRAEFSGLNMGLLYQSAFWFTSALNSNAEDRQRLNRFIQGLHKGQAPGAAFAQAFSKADLGRLANEYPLQSTSAEAVSFRRTWTPPGTPAIQLKRLDGSDGRVLVARLYGRAKATQARRFLEEAIALMPERAEAYARRALLVPASAEERRADAERAVQLEPAGRLGWEALGVALLADPRQHREKLQEVAGRLEGFEESAEAQCLAAILRDALGEGKAALSSARRAARLAPAYAYSHAVLARLAENAGQAAEAREALARAAELASGFDPRGSDLLRPDRAVQWPAGK